MMNPMRERAKAQFPTVLLTLLSIVQALALELLWSHLSTAHYLFEPSLVALVYWLQVVGTFVGIVLVWVVYASNVMRFSWVPTTMDSVLPFVIGVVEFMLVAALGPTTIGLWLILMGLVFAVMTWIAQVTMRRARQDPDNREFFVSRVPATLRDFVPQITIVSIMVLAGAYAVLSSAGLGFAAIALAGVFVLLVWQFYSAAVFWGQSIGGIAPLSEVSSNRPD